MGIKYKSSILIRLPSEIKNSLKVKAAESVKTVQSIVIELIENYLKK